MSGDPETVGHEDPLPIPGAESAERLALLRRIAEEYNSSVRAGREYDVSPHLDARPQYADDVQKLIATLDALKEYPTATALPPAPRPLIGREFGDYRILREVGRGGMGIVYEAEQLSLQRRVALKILPFTQFLSQQQLQRFTNEATIAAQLRHPNIVSVFSIGCEQDVHYYAMEFIDGPSLAQVIGQQWEPADPPTTAPRIPLSDCRESITSLPAAPAEPYRFHDVTWIPERRADQHRWAAAAIATVARALDHAHQAAVIHRDVKPSNLLFDENGNVYLTDFGLAQHQHQSAVTRTGDIVGTLRYMSPEQAAGKRHMVDARSDVYSLGVTLYESVTGRPAFPETVPADLLARLLHQEPPRVRRIDASIPNDLETIILKAIAKNPDDRYESAEALAEDLERFLSNRPILARRLSYREAAARWMWSYRVPFLLTSLAGMLLTVILAVSAVSAHFLRVRAERALADLEVAAEDAARVARREEEQRHRAELLLYVADMQAAGRAAGEGDLKRLFEILGRYESDSSEEPRRGVEWRMLRDMWTLPSEVTWSGDEPLYTVQSSPDGRSFAVAGEDATVRIFDSASGRLCLAFASGQVEVNQVVFDPTGTRMATAGDDGSVCLWQADTGREIHRFDAHDGLCYGVTFTTDGERLFSCGTDGKIRCWSIATGQSVELPLGTHGRAVEAIAASPDGRWLLSAGADQVAKLWDARTMQNCWRLKPDRAVVSVVAFGDNGLAAIATKEGTIAVFDPQEPQRIRCAAHFDSVSSLAFSRDQQTLISGDKGGVVRLWDLADRGQRMSSALDRNPYPIALVGGDTIRLLSYERFTEALQKDTTRLLEQGKLRVVQTSPLRLMANAKRHEGRVFSLEPTAGLDGFLSVGEDGDLRSWRFQDRQRAIVFGSSDEWIEHFDCLPDGRLGAVVRKRGVEFFHIASGERESTLPRGATRPCCLAVSPSSRLLAVGGSGPSFELWDCTRRELVRRVEFPAAGEVSQVVFSPDEHSVAVLCWRSRDKIPASEGVVRIFDVDSGGKLAEFPARDCNAIAFGPDRLATSLVYRDAQDLMIWRPGAAPQAIPSAHENAINTVAFSGDGALLVTASDDRSLKLWSAMGQRVATLVGHRDDVLAACFYPDGRTLVSGSADGEVRLWNVATAQPLFTHRKFATAVKQLAFTSPPTHLACRLDDGTVRLLPVGTLQAPAGIE